MRTLRFLLQKEFRQIFRDPGILRIIFMMPIIQLGVLPWAADYEVKNIQLSVVDHDHSPYTQKLINKIASSGYFKIENVSNTYEEALHEVELNRADIVMEIPAQFERSLVKEDKATIFMAVNAINGAKAGLGSAYLGSIIQDFNQAVRMEWIQLPRFSPETNIEVPSSNWFNPLLNYKYFMVPGIVVVLVTMVGSFLAALNIVREKEIGTIEQINVTPIKKYHFILGKLIPFWLLGLVILSIGLLIARLLYGIVPVGNLGAIYVFAGVYLLALLGLGLLVSTYSGTQQQAMLLAFFLMMIFIMLSGLYTSIDSMPSWAKVIAYLNPVTYFIEAMRMIVLKGSTIRDVLPHLGKVAIFAVVLNTWAIINYKKRS